MLSAIVSIFPEVVTRFSNLIISTMNIDTETYVLAFLRGGRLLNFFSADYISHGLKIMQDASDIDKIMGWLQAHAIITLDDKAKRYDNEGKK